MRATGIRRGRDVLGRWAAATLLTAVATLQASLSLTGSLSPWKGGGFGMFSTIDAPSARFVRVYLVQEAGEVPVLVPPARRPLVQRLRTLPSEDRLAELAREIAGETWIPYEITPAVLDYSRLFFGRQPPPGFQVGDSGSDWLRDLRQILEERATRPFDTRLLRAKAPDEPAPEPGRVVRFTSVRAELWRYTLDARSSRLRATRMLAASAERVRPSW